MPKTEKEVPYVIIPASKDLPAIIKGDKYDPTLYIIVNGVPKDLSACTATLTITESATDTDALLSLASSSGLTLGSDGTLEIDIEESVTATLATGTAHYALNITENNDTYTYLEGNIPIRS